MKKNVIELFAGVGGFRVGLNHITSFDDEGLAIENNNWNFVWANQWEPSTKTQHAYDCYCKRFGNHPSHSNEDINSVDKKQIPDHSLVVGGFPCQDYSVARSLSGEKGIEGKKGVLFWDIADILKHKNAPFVLLENVDRLLKSPSKQRGRDFGIMLRTFYDLGYNVEWRIINAADYGCAQKRRRVFIFAWKRNTKYNSTLTHAEDVLLKNGLFATSFKVESIDNFNEFAKTCNLTTYCDTIQVTEQFRFDFRNTGIMLDGVVTTVDTLPIYKKAITLQEIRETKDVDESYFLTETQNEKFIKLKGSKRIERKKPNGEIYYYSEGQMSYPDPLDSPGRTMLTSEASVNRSTHIIEDYKTNKLRYLTPVEAERLQSFPDNWTNSGMPLKRRYFMMGNALVTKIISILEPQLSEIIESE